MRVVVLQPHTHEGVDYPPGSVIALPDDSAAALVARGAAVADETEAPSTGAAPVPHKRNRKGD